MRLTLVAISQVKARHLDQTRKPGRRVLKERLRQDLGRLPTTHDQIGHPGVDTEPRVDDVLGDPLGLDLGGR